MARAGCRSSMAEEHWTEIPKGIPRGLPMRPLEKAPGDSPPAPDFCPSFDGQFVKGFDKTIHARFEKALGEREACGGSAFRATSRLPCCCYLIFAHMGAKASFMRSAASKKNSRAGTAP